MNDIHSNPLTIDFEDIDEKTPYYTIHPSKSIVLIYKWGPLRQIIKIEKDFFRIGTIEQSCDYIIPLQSFSQNSFIIIRNSDSFSVIFKSITNDARIGDTKINNDIIHPITEGDELKIGDFNFIVVFE